MREMLRSSTAHTTVEVEFSDEQHAALTSFVWDHATSGDWFTPQDVNELMPPELRESGDFDTIEVVRPFLPEGYGVEMHGWEDLCITKLREV